MKLLAVSSNHDAGKRKEFNYVAKKCSITKLITNIFHRTACVMLSLFSYLTLYIFCV